MPDKLTFDMCVVFSLLAMLAMLLLTDTLERNREAMTDNATTTAAEAAAPAPAAAEPVQAEPAPDPLQLVNVGGDLVCPAHVSAIENDPSREACYLIHLVGGQTVRVHSASAAEVAGVLGVPLF